MRRLTRVYFRKSRWMPEIFPAIVFLGSCLSLLVLVWVFMLLGDLLKVPILVASAILIIPFFVVFYISLLAGLLFSEKLWKLAGIYRLLKVSGSPIERHFASFGGVEVDG